MRPSRFAFDPAWFDVDEDLIWNYEALEIDEDAEIIAEDQEVDEGFFEPIWTADLREFETLSREALDIIFPNGGNILEPIAEEPEPAIDLRCYEEMPPESPFSNQDVFELDYPEIPCINCRGCRYHREQMDDPNAICSLCSMRLAAGESSKCCLYSEI